MKRKRLLLYVSCITAFVAIAGITIFRRPLAVAYHQWRMEAAYNTLFGNLTGVDADAVADAYEGHRQSLVDLDALCHLTSSFPSLAADGSEERFSERSAFVDRMWDIFPSHRHYYLAGDGTFGTWVPVDQRQDWERFLAQESEDHPQVVQQPP